MNRKFIIWTSLVALTAGIVLNTSMKTRAQEDRLAQLNAQITAEQERIRVLTAEWNSLKSPDRIEALTHRYIKDLGSIKPAQMASLADLPDPLPESALDVVAEAAKPTAAPAEAAKPVTVAQAKPVAPPKPAPVKATPVRAAAEPKPVPAPAPAFADHEDEVASLIGRTSASESVDEVRTLIERESNHALLNASYADEQ